MGLLAQSGCLLLRVDMTGSLDQSVLVKARKSRGDDWWSRTITMCEIATAK
jgi:hypothetical protein